MKPCKNCWGPLCVFCTPPKFDPKAASMPDVQAEFKRRFPRIAGLDIYTMRRVLCGEVIPVKHSGRNKFTLMTPAEVAPGGKLEQHNRAVRERNAHVRAQQRAADAEFWARPENREMAARINQTLGLVGAAVRAGKVPEAIAALSKKEEK